MLPRRHHGAHARAAASARTAAGSTTTSARRSSPRSRPGRPSPSPGLGRRRRGCRTRPSFHYVHSDQWRYERRRSRGYNPIPERERLRAPRPHGGPCRPRPCAWAGCPSTRSSTAAPSRLVEDARAAGGDDRRRDRRAGRSAAEGELKLRFSVEDPDRAGELAARAGSSGAATPSWPRPRGTSTSCSHYLGTHTNAVAEESAAGRGRGGRSGGSRAQGEDRPGRGPQLPDGHHRALLRHRPAGRHLVREGRPQLDRHALVHPPPAGGGARPAGSPGATGRSSRPSPRR